MHNEENAAEKAHCHDDLTTWRQTPNQAGEITIVNIKIIIKPVKEATRWVIMTSILLWGGVSYYPASGERLRELTAPGSNSPQTTIQGVRGNRPQGDEEQQGDQ